MVGQRPVGWIPAAGGRYLVRDRCSAGHDRRVGVLECTVGMRDGFGGGNNCRAIEHHAWL
jgi:hypothetical protein